MCIRDRRESGASAETFSDNLYVDSSFRGLGTAVDVTSTLENELINISHETRSPYEVAGDIHYDPRLCHPVPHWECIDRVAKVQGYKPEVWSLLMDANISFCEHHETGITHDIAIKHRISPPQSCLICAPASSRKSDQEAAATALLLGAAGAPAAWNERRILLSDGAKKGCENLLVDLREALNTSAEACNAIFVPGFSDPNAGIQYQSRQRLVQWTQSEGISTTTATGQMVLHPNTYKFQGRYLAQNEVGELLMAPNAQALQKRFAFACHEEAFEADIAQGLARDTHSQATLQELHSWLVTNVLPHKVTLILDGYALAFYDAVAEGVQSFLNSPPGLACDANFKVKVRFFRSDLLRQTMRAMRSAQFFGGEQQVVDPTGRPLLRSAAALEEIMLGLNRCSCVACKSSKACAPPVSYTHLTLPTTPYV